MSNEWLNHQGHKIVVARYTDTNNDVINVSIECEECWQVLADEEVVNV